MKKKKTFIRLAAVVLLMALVLACTVSLDWGREKEEKSPAEQTLEALYVDQTAAALPVVVDTVEEESASVPIIHDLVPGNPGSPDVEKNEIDTENTADTRTALGDSFRLGNFERPFTESVMAYHPELDIVKLELSAGDDFYYFTFILSGPGTDGFGAGYYGVEFDSDYDGRGDYLLWAKSTSSTEWLIDDVMLLEDLNGDVGGLSPVLPDKSPGDGYEHVLFGPEALDDPDVAWVRASGNNIQLAVKRSYIDKNRWYWRAWADAGITDPARFDYNDQFSEEQAGSPNKNSGMYPIAALSMMDSTCWIAYNLEPTGTELGGCVQIQPTQEPPPPPTPTEKPPCDCSGTCSSYSGEFCCEYCGCTWYDSPEFKYCAN